MFLRRAQSRRWFANTHSDVSCHATIRRDTWHRRLHYEPLEPRSLLSVGATLVPQNVADPNNMGLVTDPAAFGFALNLGAANQVAFAGAIAGDAAGNTYVTGSYQGTVDFDPGPGEAMLSSEGSDDVFVAKYAPAGTLVWARDLGGADSDRGVALAVGPDGSVCIIRNNGPFYDGNIIYTSLRLSIADQVVGLSGTGQASVDPPPINPNSPGRFVSKLDAAGNVVWQIEVPNATDLAVSETGSVFVTTTTSVVKFDAAGASLGNIAIQAEVDLGGSNIPRQIALGPNGGMVIATTSGVFQVDSLGNPLWTRNTDRAAQIAVGPQGNVCMTTGSSVSQLDAAGNVVWTQNLTGGPYDNYDIALAADGSVLVATRATRQVPQTYTTAAMSAPMTPAATTSSTSSWAIIKSHVSLATSSTISLQFNHPTYEDAIRIWRFDAAGNPSWDTSLVGKVTQRTEFLVIGSAGNYSDQIALAASPDGSALLVAGLQRPMTVLTSSQDPFAVSNVGLTDVLVAKVRQLGAKVERAADQAEQTTQSPVHFTVIFSNPVGSFTADQVTLTGTALGKQVTKITGNGTTYDVEVRAANFGTIGLKIDAGKVHDPTGLANMPSTGADNTVYHVAALPEIAVLHGNAVLVSGQTTPIDLGSAVRRSEGNAAVFTIRNDGIETLHLGTPFVSTAHFRVGQPDKTSLALGETATFTVTLKTETIWSGSEQLSFINNDGGNGDGVENPFRFRVSGTVTPSPGVLTLLDGSTIVNDQNGPIDVGFAVQGMTGAGKTFTVRNDGDDVLQLTTPFVDTPHFIVGQPGKSTLLAGETTTFRVALRTDTGWQGVESVRVAAQQGEVSLLLSGRIVTGLANPSGYSPSTIRKAYGVDTITFGVWVDDSQNPSGVVSDTLLNVPKFSFSTVVGDGAGQTIVIVGVYDNPKFVDSTDPGFPQSDLHLFDAALGLPDPPSFRKLDQTGGVNYPIPDPAPLAEMSWASETALDVEWAHAMAPAANIVLIESNSPSASDFFTTIETARHLPGVSVISISGGWLEEQLGAEALEILDALFTTPAGHQGITFVASSGDRGSPGTYPALSPNVVAVGGTSLDLGYIDQYSAEQAWGGSGGGQSLYADEPAYQQGVQQSGRRQIPDVAFCADPDRGVAVYDSQDFGTAQPWVQMGGTSLGAPCWAGLIAIANQMRASKGLDSLDGPSQTLPGLYALPVQAFHDITSGGNGSFLAEMGFDMVTGLGSPMADRLVPSLALLEQASPPTAFVWDAAAQDVFPRGTDELIVGFDAPVMGGLDGANFELRGLGADGLLGTGDDLFFLLAASFATLNDATVLSFSELPEGIYRLTVHESITDVRRNQLDGDRDGAAGGDFVFDFVVADDSANEPSSLTTAGGRVLQVATGAVGAGELIACESAYHRNAFNGHGRLMVDGASFQADGLAFDATHDGQSVVIGAGLVSGLTVSRQITVPNTGSVDFARTVDRFTNPTVAPITATVEVVGNLGSDAETTVFATSDGDQLVEASDQWIGTDGNGTPAIIHYLHGPSGLQPDSVEVIGDNIRWIYTITVPAKKTVELAYFTIVASTRVDAVAATAVLVGPLDFGGRAGAFLSSADTASLANFQFPAPVADDDLEPHAIRRDTIGLFTSTASTFFLRNSNSGGYADLAIAYGPANAGWIPLSGDWDGDGVDTIGLYNPTTAMFLLRNNNTGGYADVAFVYGPAALGWKSIAGDWNGDGTDTIGLYNPTTATFYLRNSNSSGFADLAFAYGPGNAGLTPIVGDWNGDRQDTVGLYRPGDSVFLLRNTNTAGYADRAFSYGPANAGWKPVVGDWNADGLQTVGLCNSAASTFFLRNDHSAGYADLSFAYGPANAGWTPLIGDWNGPESGLHAAGGEVLATPDIAPLTTATLEPILSEAIARWAAAGLSRSALAMLEQVDVRLLDLPGSSLGQTEGNTITLDRDAAGHGWFIDRTPALNEEFMPLPNSPSMHAIDPRAVDRIDLLTVVTHELGHLAGFDDLDVLADNLMSRALGTGVRRNVF